MEMLRCVGCGTTAFDPEPGGEHRTDAVMSLRRFWVKASDTDGNPIGDSTYAVCNACLDAQIGFLWNDDGTLGRVFTVGDAETA